MTRSARCHASRLTTILAVVLAVLLVVGAAFAVRSIVLRPKTITAYFPSATAIYPGDEVRVSGVKVGTITSIEPQGTQAKMVMHVDRDVPIPADAKAVIVAQNLVAARYVQLTPPYRSSGPTMHDGAVIPIDRTAVPVEWDEVKNQLMRLATDLGPTARCRPPSVARFIDSAANALDGNGDKLRQTLAQLSGVSADSRRRQRQHRRHHQEPADLRHGAARQQHPDRAVPEPAGHADQRARRQQVRPGRGA